MSSIASMQHQIVFLPVPIKVLDTSHIVCLCRMSHRGACGCEENTGDTCMWLQLNSTALCIPHIALHNTYQVSCYHPSR